VLQCAAVCCSVLQCAAVCNNVLQCVAVCHLQPAGGTLIHEYDMIHLHVPLTQCMYYMCHLHIAYVGETASLSLIECYVGERVWPYVYKGVRRGRQSDTLDHCT